MSGFVHTCRDSPLLQVVRRTWDTLAHVAEVTERQGQPGAEAKGCGQGLVSLILFLWTWLPPCWLCCPIGFPLVVTKWLPSLQPYMFPEFTAAYVFSHGSCRGLEEHGLDGPAPWLALHQSQEIMF